VSLASTIRLALLAILFATPSSIRAGPEGEIEVVVEGLRSSEGKLLAQLFAGPVGFPNDSTKATHATRLSLEASSPRLVFAGIPFGEYAISVCHDENGNAHCDVNLLGMPKEGVGISRGALRRLGRPRFDDAKVVLDSPRASIEIQVRY